MTPLSPGTLDRSLTPPANRPARPAGSRLDVTLRVLATVALAVGYFRYKAEVVGWLQQLYMDLTGAASKPTTLGIWVVVVLMVGLIWLWRRTLAKDKRFHAPLLVTAVLVVGDAGFGILENHFSPTLARLTGGLLTQYSPTFVAILTTVLTEMVVGRSYYGKWPHLASAYVSGISAGILIKSPEVWPFVLCGMLSITSKYVLRTGGRPAANLASIAGPFGVFLLAYLFLPGNWEEKLIQASLLGPFVMAFVVLAGLAVKGVESLPERHLWNPTNFGVSAMLLLGPQHVASLSVQAGNSVWGVAVIWVLGGMILWNLGRLHQAVAFLVTFVPLSYLRSLWTGDRFLTEVAPITSPMFQLYMFFMITDPKTTTKGKWSQTLVVVLVAVMETVYRLAFRDVHSLYHALFTVGPITNLIEIAYFYRSGAGQEAGPPGGEVTPKIASLSWGSTETGGAKLTS
ncbi:MAG: hypothetical protein U0797_21235 [Gemmataceae bacterium]